MRTRQRGQATLEMAALAPVVLGLMLLTLQVIISTYTAHAASQAAREAARAYSLEQPPRPAAMSSLPGGIRLVSVQASGPDHTVTVTVEAPISLFAGDSRVTRSVTMP